MASSTFPDATNTGVPAGTTLTAYTGPMTITEPGTVIDGKIITGQLRVLADNVVIKNSKISFSGSWGIDGYGAKNLTVQDCDITGPGYSAGSDSAIAGTGNFLRNDISKVQNGITLNDGSSVVQGNYIHNLESAGADPHYDGIQAFGGHVNTKIIGNTVLARDTSCILISDLWGNNNGIEVRGNFFGGNPGAPIYVTGDHYANDRGGTGSGTLNVVIEDNAIAKGVYDYFYIVDANPVIRNNSLLPQGTLPDSVSGGGTGGGGTVGTTHTGTDGNDVMPAAGQSNSGNEKYYGLAGNDTLHGGAGADHLDGGAGYDTATYSGSNAGVTVSLATGKGTGGHAQGDTLVSVDHLIGSNFADKLYGNSGNNYLVGGAGADYLDGGRGNDTASYSSSNAGVTVSLATRKGWGGHAQGDTLTNIEYLTGSRFADNLYGNAGNNLLKGGAGADYLDGGSGSDTASYAGSNAGVSVSLQTQRGWRGHAEGDKLVNIENLTGSSFADNLYANAGNNVLTGGAGADYLDGGSGRDMASYAGSNAGVTVDLRTGKGSGGHAQGDKLVSIENLGGSSHNDKFVGNDNTNLLSGGVGNDTLYGMGGNDVLKGGAGNDVLIGGVGKDAFVFDTALNASTNVDRITDFSVVDDVIHLDNAVFKALTNTGTLSSGYVHKNTTGLAHDANDHIIYETDTGKLFYDSNGSASGGSVHFATLSPNLNLTAADFVVI